MKLTKLHITEEGDEWYVSFDRPTFQGGETIKIDEKTAKEIIQIKIANMNNIKEGTILTFTGDETEPKEYKREVLGVCGKIVFTRDILENGFSAPDFFEVDDLITMGWKL